MALLQVDFETPASGTGLTTANTGPSTLAAVTPGTGTIAASNAQAMHDAQSGLFTPGNAQACFIQLDTGSAATTRVGRVYLRMTGFPSVNTQFMRFNSAGINTLVVDTTGHLILLADGATIWTSTAVMALNTWYRIEYAATISASGYMAAAVYPGDSTSPLDSFSTNTGNAGTDTAWTSCQIGKVSATGTWAAMNIDDFATLDATTTFLGPSQFLPSLTMAPMRGRY